MNYIPNIVGDGLVAAPVWNPDMATALKHVINDQLFNLDVETEVGGDLVNANPDFRIYSYIANNGYLYSLYPATNTFDIYTLDWRIQYNGLDDGTYKQIARRGDQIFIEYCYIDTNEVVVDDDHTGFFIDFLEP